MDVSEAVSALKDAKKIKKDWQEVAGIVRFIQESGYWQQSFSTPSAWLDKVAETTGYSVGVIRRMCATYDFLQKISSEISDFELLKKSTDAKFNFPTIEIFKRLYDLKPDDVRKLLPEFVQGQKSSGDIREIYLQASHSAVSNHGNDPRLGKRDFVNATSFSRKAGKIAVKEFIQHASVAIEAQLKQVTASETCRFYTGQYKFKYVRPQAVAFELDGYSPKWVDGFDFKHLSGAHSSPGNILTVSSIALACSFFRHYWLVVPKHERMVQRLLEDFENLRLNNAGLIAFDEETGSIELKLVPQGVPMPDRQHHVVARVVEQGIPELVEF
ncbi:hypothetical protein [Kordiimonas laminariae]|uniref:hypothetical protein n=1 Tax=Kordiimonas laminariae TaxID=2917717 RepID=UPI001FF2BFA4|nr:hypothetical protein [Kordiimonas laminariae]MCK0069411.1 hypothetical protein [Kordiimonas laminariae]